MILVSFSLFRSGNFVYRSNLGIYILIFCNNLFLTVDYDKNPI